MFSNDISVVHNVLAKIIAGLVLVVNKAIQDISIHFITNASLTDKLVFT